MGENLVKQYTLKPRTTVDKFLDSIVCDMCKKIISEKHEKYYFVHTHHSDWGNDSIDSSEFYDFCSYKCLAKHQQEYFEHANGSEEYDIELEYVD